MAIEASRTRRAAVRSGEVVEGRLHHSRTAAIEEASDELDRRKQTRRREEEDIVSH